MSGRIEYQLRPKPETIDRGALFSDDGRYRHALWRSWGAGRRMTWVMLNPSTADANKDDSTIRRCIGFANDWGYSSFYVINLCDYVATAPKDMLSLPYAQLIEGRNEDHNRSCFKKSDLVVCAWGANAAKSKALVLRCHTMLNEIRASDRVPHYLKMTKSGHPAHPLMLPRHLTPKMWWFSALNL